jgi:hypothetical protein
MSIPEGGNCAHGCRRRPPQADPASKNIKNNPMQRKQPLANTGVVGTDAYPAKNILTRRANQGHIFIIAQFVSYPTLPIGLVARLQAQIPQLKQHRLARSE